MSFRFSIGKKIGTGFSVLILLIIVVFGATFIAVHKGIKTFKKNDETSIELIEIITPSKEKISTLRYLLNESEQLSIQWVNNESSNDVKDKKTLRNLIAHSIPNTFVGIDNLKSNWKDSSKIKLLDNIKLKVESLFGLYAEVMRLLPDIDSYDEFNFFFARELVAQDGDIPDLAEEIDNNLLKLLNSFERKEEKALQLVKTSSTESKIKFESLKFYWYLGAALIFGAIVIAIFTTNSIVRPVRELRSGLYLLGKGEFPKETIQASNDEIGDMTLAMNNLVDGLKSTTVFARHVGQSKFDINHTPLSNNDELGHALIAMRNELAETERILEKKVEERTQEAVKQRDEIDAQREKLQDLYKDVTDSIKYAKRLQYSILPSQEKIKAVCPDSFVYFEPKDIVSGDFYWFEKVNNTSLYAAVDCTGHGVPGAFMSLVGANGLNSAVREHKITKPSEILNQLNKYVSESLNNDEDGRVRDGMDMTICAICYDTMTLEYAGANNPLYIIRNGEFIITKANKFAIASFTPGEKEFINHKIKLKPNDLIYVFSDGYVDQFGGERGKKFMHKNFRKLLLDNHHKPLSEQKSMLYNTLHQWKGSNQQIDDILIIGLKI